MAELEHAIGQARSQYFRLVLVVGLPGSGKTAALQALAQKIDSHLVNVNRELSRKLLELTRKQRSHQVGRLFKEVIDPISGEVVILDNLEILFDIDLEVEPLRLLQILSRNRTVIASWNGTFRDGTLTYAEPGHPEFIQFKQTEAIVITLNQITTP
ncbi:MAG TPA: BREX-3 system P-loop-containing protein BrxF [Acidobacteriota bacterium]|nr:BREX-3 system P-loop-containing protein BrxF [Acidobacteriota bacterium]HMZ82490.1 BREX-3 system P-loop-containing protein BrxF [Acidobacteriota bacterium]